MKWSTNVWHGRKWSIGKAGEGDEAEPDNREAMNAALVDVAVDEKELKQVAPLISGHGARAEVEVSEGSSAGIGLDACVERVHGGADFLGSGGVGVRDAWCLEACLSSRRPEGIDGSPLARR